MTGESADGARSYGITLRGRHRSMQDLEWADLPPLVVVTGINGSGKSHLLQAIGGARVVGEMPAGQRPERGMWVRFQGVEWTPADVRLVSDAGAFQRTRPAVAADLRSRVAALLAADVGEDEEGRFRAAVRAVAGAGEDAVERVLDSPGVLLRNPDVLQGLTDVFMRHQLSAADAMARGVGREKLRSELGVPPWDSLNALLTAASFPYRVRRPSSDPAEYRLEMKAADSDVTVEPGDLSPGERAILASLLWRFAAGYEHALPRLLLLDEPDAHLHSPMTRAFLDVVERILVRQHGVRVILATRSASTVAQVPPESVFEIRRNAPRIVRPRARWSTAGLLANGILLGGPDAKHVFVGDRDDVAFLQATQRVVQRPLPLSDKPPLLPGYPPLTFVPAFVPIPVPRPAPAATPAPAPAAASEPAPGSETASPSTEAAPSENASASPEAASASGDASASAAPEAAPEPPAPPTVAECVALLPGPHVHGVVGKADAVPDQPKVRALGRHQPENYLADPVVVFACLRLRREAPEGLLANLAIGDESRMRSQPVADVQAVVDQVLERIEPHLGGGLEGDEDAERVSVTIVAGPTLAYPRWFLATRGSLFLDAIREAFGIELTWDELRVEYERTGWVPVELFAILRSIQLS